MRPEEIIKSLGYELPEIPSPLGAYVPVVEVKGLIFVSGLLPIRDGRIMYQGRIGAEVSIPEAKECAVQVVLNCLSLLRSCSLDLSRLRCVRMNGYLCTTGEFKDHPQILNPASELLLRVFQERGRHTRVAIGVFSLPMSSPIEMDFIWSLED